jgi:hypothetical protein
MLTEIRLNKINSHSLVGVFSAKATYDRLFEGGVRFMEFGNHVHHTSVKFFSG